MVEQATKKQIDDYEFLKPIGEGAFGTVYLAKEKSTEKLFAIKALDKDHIVKNNKTKHVYREKDILNRFKAHPHIIKLVTTFQDKLNLYFVFESCNNGTLSNLIKQLGRLDEELVRVYTAEIVLVLEEIHSKNVMHRDLKPENILLCSNYHLKIIDFGDANYIVDETSKDQEKESQQTKSEQQQDDEFSDQNIVNERRGTFVGTAYYVSPEMLSDNRSCPSSDLWALGCILFKMLTGEVPFSGQHDYVTFQMILQRKLIFPPDAEFSEEARDLIDKLLQTNPSDRLGGGEPGSAKDFNHLKSHPFFKGLDFRKVSSEKVPLPKDFVFEQDGQNDYVEIKEESSSIVYSGELKKKNKFFWNQARLFQLLKEGKINYYKDEVLYRGTIQLCKETKVVKTGRDRFEIQTPHRVYYLSETDNSKLSSDAWIEKIKQVIHQMK